MVINQVGNKSIYLKQTNKSNDPVYIAARQTAIKYSKTKMILELAGGPLYSTGELSQQGYAIVNLELDPSLIDYCRQKYPSVATITTNLEKPLPYIKDIENVDVVMAIDILEHLDWKTSIELLKNLKDKISNDYVCYVSIPIIDWRFFNTWYEFIKAVAHPFKKRTNLFDSTHRILTDQKGHRKLFKEANYEILEEYNENGIQFLTGVWPNMDPNKFSWVIKPNRELNLKMATIRFLALLFHPCNSEKRKQFTINNSLVRGIYIIRPIKNK